jgi:hypothetical protein
MKIRLLGKKLVGKILIFQILLIIVSSLALNVRMLMKILIYLLLNVCRKISFFNKFNSDSFVFFF